MSRREENLCQWMCGTGQTFDVWREEGSECAAWRRCCSGAAMRQEKGGRWAPEKEVDDSVFSEVIKEK